MCVKNLCEKYRLNSFQKSFMREANKKLTQKLQKIVRQTCLLFSQKKLQAYSNLKCDSDKNVETGE